MAACDCRSHRRQSGLRLRRLVGQPGRVPCLLHPYRRELELQRARFVQGCRAKPRGRHEREHRSAGVHGDHALVCGGALLGDYLRNHLCESRGRRCHGHPHDHQPDRGRGERDQGMGRWWRRPLRAPCRDPPPHAEDRRRRPHQGRGPGQDHCCGCHGG